MWHGRGCLAGAAGDVVAAAGGESGVAEKLALDLVEALGGFCDLHAEAATAQGVVGNLGKEGGNAEVGVVGWVGNQQVVVVFRDAGVGEYQAVGGVAADVDFGGSQGAGMGVDKGYGAVGVCLCQ